MYLGKFLKNNRAEKGWTQDDMSEKLGIPRTTYASYEQNRSRFDESLIRKLSSLFQMPADEIRSFAEVKAGEFQEYPAPYGNTGLSNDLWQAKQQECNDLREHNKDLKLLVETQQKMVETKQTLVDTQKKLIESLEQQLQPFKEIKEKAGANG